MKQDTKTGLMATRHAESGFTLVELAIVMIIIGLLIGGVLKGQELIRGAETSALIAQTKTIDTAMLGFRETYRAVPGDGLAAVFARIPNCGGAGTAGVGTVACNVAGDGDNTIDGDIGVAQGAEGQRAWVQMVSADFLPSRIDGPNTDGFTSEINGGVFAIGWHNVGAFPAAIGGGNARSGHYISLTSNANTGVVTTMRATQAARIDRKLDDGVPNTGSVQGAGCIVGALYNEAAQATGCTLAISLTN